MISLSLTLEREFDDYVTIRRLNHTTIKFSSKVKGDNLSFHKLSSLGCSNLVEIQNTKVVYLRYEGGPPS